VLLVELTLIGVGVSLHVAWRAPCGFAPGEAAKFLEHFNRMAAALELGALLTIKRRRLYGMHEDVAVTSYYTDYQGVRFIVLDGTAGTSLDALDAQTRWLDRSLASSTARWNIVVQHQPIYTCARPNDTEALKAAWEPIYRARGVDMVLQGHDHCYSRITDGEGKASGEARRAQGAAQGPVYVVSVAGPKMYGLNNRALTQPDRVAADTQMYQTIDVEAGRLRYRAYTVSGVLYDAADIVRAADGTKTLREPAEALPPLRLCDGGAGPDGAPCVGSTK